MERARIARDLHDSVLQTFYAIALTASSALRMLPTQETQAAQNSFEEVLRLANVGQSELRSLLTNIHPDPRMDNELIDGLAALGADLQ